MYITINGVRYDDAKRTQNNHRITYISSALTADLVAVGSIGEYRDDGFLLREVDVSGYARQIARDGVLTLTNEPEPVPVEPVDPEPTAEELMNILLGGDEA